MKQRDRWIVAGSVTILIVWVGISIDFQKFLEPPKKNRFTIHLSGFNAVQEPYLLLTSIVLGSLASR